MTDQFDPTMRSRESWTGGDEPDRSAGAGLTGDTTTTVTRTTTDDLVSPHDQPVEGGREQVADIEGAETAVDEAPFDRR
jgi:hypothetical protein